MSTAGADGDVLLTVVGPARPPDADPTVPRDPDSVLLEVCSNGRVTAYSGKVEYGQGIRSGFARAIAAELDVDVAVVDIVLGDTARVPYDRGTTGSASTRTVGLQLRRAAATARQVIVDAAAARWEVPANRVLTGRGQAWVDEEPSPSAAYQELLYGAPARVELRQDVRLQLLGVTTAPGSSVRAAAADVAYRVTGQARYSRDITLPGMLHGRILRPPSYGARLRDLDTSRAERVAGVVAVIKEDGFVGVVAEREDVAAYALEAVRARWDENRTAASDWNLPALLKEKAQPPAVLREHGSVQKAFDRADRVFSGTYFVPYVANAQMEPSAAVAAWDGDSLTVWCGNRGPFAERSSLAGALKMPEDRIRVIAAEVGGSFGTKTPTVGVEAARLARAVGRPVRVTYSRAEEFAWSTVRPAALIEIRSAVDRRGQIEAWEHIAYHAGENAFRGRRGADTPYKTPNVRIAVANSESPLVSGSYRSLGGAVNHFARECHIDEMAARTGADPVEFRLSNLDHPRFRRVLETAARTFGWDRNRSTKEPNTGRGVALGFDVGSYVAECAELTVRDREVSVRRVVAAFDCGLTIDPDGVRNQVEGSIMMGIGTALWEAIEFDGGRILNPGFGRYRVPRIADTPDIQVELIDDPAKPSTGAGEPAIVPIAAAVANAVRDAMGFAATELPIVPRLP